MNSYSIFAYKLKKWCDEPVKIEPLKIVIGCNLTVSDNEIPLKTNCNFCQPLFLSCVAQAGTILSTHQDRC